MADRKTQFKNLGRTEDELRRRRNEVTVELRKNKREESLQKRRNVPVDLDTSGDLENGTEKQTEYVSLPIILQQAQDPDPETRLNAIRQARRALSREKNPPIVSHNIHGSYLMPVMLILLGLPCAVSPYDPATC